MKERIKRYIFILVFFLMIIGILKLVQSKLFYISQIEIEGTNDILKKDIVDKLYDFKGKPITNVNKNILENEILQDTRVKDIRVIKKYPNKLIIQINERKPLAYVLISDKLFVVDKDMNIFSTYEELNGRTIPLITTTKENTQNILNILKELYKSRLYPLSSEIYEEGGKYIITLEDGVNVYVTENVDEKKLNQGYIVYNKEKEQNNSMEYIDLRFELISVR